MITNFWWVKELKYYQSIFYSKHQKVKVKNNVLCSSIVITKK